MNDPAVLFYTSDFLTGVIDMTMEERGQYITLLCYQHQRGHIKEETIRLLVGSCSVNVLNHFKIDNNGLYYNERMDIEIEKRHNFTASRRENGKKGGRPKKPIGKPSENLVDNLVDNHMGNLMGNDNDNENINKNIYKNIYEYIEENFNITISGKNYEDIYEWLKYFSQDILKYAVDISVASGKRTINYWNGILNNWKGFNYKSLNDIKENENKKNKKTKSIPNWLDKEIQPEIATEEEQNEINKFLKDFK